MMNYFANQMLATMIGSTLRFLTHDVWVLLRSLLSSLSFPAVAAIVALATCVIGSKLRLKPKPMLLLFGVLLAVTWSAIPHQASGGRTYASKAATLDADRQLAAAAEQRQAEELLNHTILASAAGVSGGGGLGASTALVGYGGMPHMTQVPMPHIPQPVIRPGFAGVGGGGASHMLTQATVHTWGPSSAGLSPITAPKAAAAATTAVTPAATMANAPAAGVTTTQQAGRSAETHATADLAKAGTAKPGGAVAAAATNPQAKAAGDQTVQKPDSKPAGGKAVAPAKGGDGSAGSRHAEPAAKPVTSFGQKPGKHKGPRQNSQGGSPPMGMPAVGSQKTYYGTSQHGNGGSPVQPQQSRAANDRFWNEMNGNHQQNNNGSAGGGSSSHPGQDGQRQGGMGSMKGSHGGGMGYPSSAASTNHNSGRMTMDDLDQIMANHLNEQMNPNQGHPFHNGGMHSGGGVGHPGGGHTGGMHPMTGGHGGGMVRHGN